MDGRAAATFILISVSLLSRSAADDSLKQSPQTLLVNTKGRSCRFYCDIGSQLSDGTLIHWYRQTEGKEVERILYQNSGEYINDEGFKQRFTGGKRDRRIILTVTGATPKDAGIYYCAYWDFLVSSGGNSYYIKRFGAGTKLIVSETPAKQPDVSVFRASKDRVACVAYGFFPDVIKFEWKKKVGGKTIDLQGEKDEQLDLPITKIEDGSDKYSATSLLIYKGGNPSFKFVCVVNHEGFTNPAEFIEAIPDGPATSSGRVPAEGDLETDNCKAPYAEGLDFQPFNVATLSYTLFILKSVVYCAVVVYLTYQNKSV